MASKRAHRRRSCESKVRHETQTGAVTAMRKMGSPRGLHSYKCPFCKGWHVGRMTKEKKQALAQRR